MPYDFSLHPLTGDWLWSANRDIQGVSGPDQVAQRIHTRLKVKQGSWIYDQDKTLGSLLGSMLTAPRTRVVNELSLIIEHALEPMRDVEITNIEMEDLAEEDTKVRVHIFFRPRFAPGVLESEDARLSATTFLDIPII
jgi:hypothetical protein